MKKLLMVLALLIATNAFAEGNHYGRDKHKHVTNITEVTEVTNVTYTEDDSVLAGAIGIHNFDYGTYATQISVSAAFKEGSEAISGAIAHRDCKDCGLFSASIAIAEINRKAKSMIGIGYTWSY